jgi:hypothetical protein
VVEALIPQSEIRDLIVELRSATAGVGTFSSRFDHLAELTGKVADQIVERARAGAQAAGSGAGRRVSYDPVKPFGGSIRTRFVVDGAIVCGMRLRHANVI